MDTRPDRVKMSELRNKLTFDWDKWPPSSLPAMLALFHMAIEPNVPADPTEDFFVGAEWMAALLIFTNDKGVPLTKGMVFDMVLAVLHYKRTEDNPFMSMDDFDKAVLSEQDEATIERIDKLVEGFMNRNYQQQRRKENEDDD